jgi:hypothetical protein
VSCAQASGTSPLATGSSEELVSRASRPLVGEVLAAGDRGGALSQRFEREVQCGRFVALGLGERGRGDEAFRFDDA